MSFTEFGVTDLFQCRTYPREVFLQLKLTGDANRAAGIALPQIFIMAFVGLAMIFVGRRLPWEMELNLERSASFPPSPIVVIGALFVFALSVLLPLGSILWNAASSIAFRNLWTPVLAEQIGNSLVFAFWTMLATVLAATVLCVIAERILREWRPVVYGLALVPFLLPATLIAVAVIAVTSDWPQLSATVSDTALPAIYTNAARLLPVAMLLISTTLRLADRSAEEASRIEGESEWRAPLRITLLPSALTIAATALVVFAFSLGDVAITSLLQPPGGQTVAIAIFNMMHYSHEPEVALLCLILIALIMVPVFVSWYLWQRGRRLLEKEPKLEGER